MTKYILVLTPITALIVSCAPLFKSGTVDCGSGEAQDLVASISKENSALASTLLYKLNKPGSRFEHDYFGDTNSDPELSQLKMKSAAIKSQIEYYREQCIKAVNYSADWYTLVCSSDGAMLGDPEDLLEKINQGKTITYMGNKQKIINDEIVALRNAAQITNVQINPLVKQLSEVNSRISEMEKSSEMAAKQKSEAAIKEWRIAKNNIQYGLVNIITTKIDETVSSATCKAVLTAELEGESAESEISYKLETTSKGDMYATVWGI